jgi:hypothetical protein
MDIGKTLRCYTIEPLNDPIPRRLVERETEAVPTRQGWDRAPYAVDHDVLLHADSTLASMMLPSHARRLSA